ncbi:MAG: lysophospholipid acyltransferase family protein [Planctomycetota bacterium]
MDPIETNASAAIAERKSGRGAFQSGGTPPGAFGQFLFKIIFRTLYLIIHLLLRGIVFVKREGPPIPKGAVILAPNHCSLIDPPVIQMADWRHISFMMTDGFYNPPLTRWFFQAFRAIPVKEGRGNRDAIRAAVEALNRGWTVCIFPEGGIAKDGKLQKFHPGITVLAEAANASVVPIAVIGTFEAFPRHAKFPKMWRKVIVRHGAPIPPPEASGDEASRKELLRTYADKIRDAVAQLQMQ